MQRPRLCSAVQGSAAYCVPAADEILVAGIRAGMLSRVRPAWRGSLALGF